MFLTKQSPFHGRSMRGPRLGRYNHAHHVPLMELEPLERRELLSVYAVSVVSAEGRHGSAGLITTGDIHVNSAYDPDGDGIALVDASSRSAAVAAALQGTARVDATQYTRLPADKRKVYNYTFGSTDAFKIAPGIEANPAKKINGKDALIKFDDLFAVNTQLDWNDHFWDVKVKQIKVDIISTVISFDDQGIKQDTGTQALYAKPQWNDLNGDGVITGPAETKSPISFARSTPGQDNTIGLTVKFTLRDKPIGSYRIKGEAIGNFSFNSLVFEGNATISGNDLTATIYGSKALPDYITRSNLTIKWTIVETVNSQLPDVTKIYGNSVDRLYLTGVAIQDQLHTVLDIACRNATGDKPDNDAGKKKVVDDIWANFSRLEVRRADGSIMKYAHGNGAGFSYQDLILLNKGTCDAWSTLLVTTLNVAGVNANSWVARPVLPPPISTPPGYTLSGNGIMVKLMAAQGSAGVYKTTNFDSHVIVLIPSLYPNTIYDPSYGYRVSGASLTTAKVLWENHSLVAVYYEYTSQSLTQLPWNMVYDLYNSAAVVDLQW